MCLLLVIEYIIARNIHTRKGDSHINLYLTIHQCVKIMNQTKSVLNYLGEADLPLQDVIKKFPETL